jgi:uncharacterized protein YndB with AHSA1/START domain
MTIFQPDPNTIRWQLHLKSSPAQVYQTLATDAGRATFWAESAIEQNSIIHFIFPNHLTWDAPILKAEPPYLYSIQYYGGSLTTFALADDGHGGTDLTLTDTGVPAPDRPEVIAGWVSVLLSLKAAVDFDIDLRTHDPLRHWDTGYAEN